MLEELSVRLENLKVDTNVAESSKGHSKAESRKTLIKCISLQLKFQEITKQVEKSFSIVILAQGSMSTAILCTTSFALIMKLDFIKKFDKYFVQIQISSVEEPAVFIKLISNMVPMIYQTYLPCLYGTEMLEN